MSNIKHNGCKTPEYSAWAKLRERCTNPKQQSYPDYGGRGITVCARWGGPESFPVFLADMGPRPSAKHSIDRKDNKKGYWCGQPKCPDCGPLGREPNCRWATKGEQSRNRIVTRWITHNGQTKCLKDWANSLGLAAQTLHSRLKKHSVETALTKPYGRWPNKGK